LGDNNTSFFHRIANGRKRKHTMFSLKEGNYLVEGTDDLLEHATIFYKKLFGPGEGNILKLSNNIWLPHEKLNFDDNLVLNEPFSEDEVKFALDRMVKNKAPGPDGIPVEFYQVCWRIVKHDIMAVFDDWYAGELDLFRLNFGMIILLQKSKDADVISKYRPICLLQVMYKLITKVATIRVEPFMGKLSSSCQTAFIKGRNIMDGIMSLHEIL
jgi:hypothetical protein